MLIAFTCQNCGKDYQKDATLAGKKGRCSECGHIFEIPGPPRSVSAGTVKESSPARSSGNHSSGSSSRAPGLASSRQQPARSRAAAAGNVSSVLDDDPYGLNDVPIAPRAAAIAPEDELLLPRRSGLDFPGPKTTSGPRTPPRRDRGDFFDGLPGFVYLAAAAVLGSGFLVSLMSPTAGAYLFLGGAVLSFLVFFLYGLSGLIVIPFRDGFWTGFLCWTCLPYLLGYTLRRRDVMGGVVLSLVASFGVIILMALALPGMAVLNRGNAAPGRIPKQTAQGPPRLPEGMPPNFPGGGFPPPAMRGPPPLPTGVQPPVMTSAITLKVRGLNDQASGTTFGDKLTELVKRVSGGYQLSGSGGGGQSTYSISMQNTINVQTFADQISWARVTRVAGQTIEIDATAVSGE